MTPHRICKKIVTNPHVCIGYLDKDFNFILVNQAFADAHMRDQKFFPGKNHFEIYPHAKNQILFQKVLDSGQPITFHAKPLKFQDQPERGVTYWDWTLEPIKRKQSKKFDSLILTMVDVTEATLKALKSRHTHLKTSHQLHSSKDSHLAQSASTINITSETDDCSYHFPCEQPDVNTEEYSLHEEMHISQRYLDAVNVSLIVLDDQHKVTLINKKGCELLGYEKADVIGKDWFSKFLPTRHREATRNVFKKLMAGEVEPVKYFENPIVTKTGEERLIAWHNNYIIDETGAITGVISSGLDITDRKQIDKALRRIHGKLEERVALRTHEFEQTNSRLMEEMRRHKNTLAALEMRDKELERKNKRIAETNTALRVLLKNRDTEKEEHDADLQMRLNSLVTPLLTKLQGSSLNDEQMAYLEMLRQNLNTILAPTSATPYSWQAKLTTTEIQVANFIKQRKTNKEIAQIMGSSPRTVEKHRDHLRKKMGIQNRKINLREFLLYHS